MAAEEDLVESYMVTRSVSFHGHELLKAIAKKNPDSVNNIHAQLIDYKIQKARIPEITKIGIKKQQRVINFVANKTKSVFAPVEDDHDPWNETNAHKNEERFYKDKYKHRPPIEYFMNVNSNICRESFFENLKRGDVLLGFLVRDEPGRASKSYRNVRVFAFDCGPHRCIPQLNVMAKLPLAEITETMERIASANRCIPKLGLRVEVVNINIEKYEIIVGTKGVALPPHLKDIKLGLYEFDTDFLLMLKTMSEKKIKSFSDSLSKMDSFVNPRCVTYMSEQLSLNINHHFSLMEQFRKSTSTSKTCDDLRAKQTKKWSNKYVLEGVTAMKMNRRDTAQSRFTQALKIDPDNDEALVAHGALLANEGNFEKAIDCFERALQINPDHVNAKAYICETLYEHGKRKEGEKNYLAAEKSYTRCLELNPSHSASQSSLESIVIYLPVTPKILHKQPLIPESSKSNDLKAKDQTLNSEPHYNDDQNSNSNHKVSPLKRGLDETVQPKPKYRGAKRLRSESQVQDSEVIVLDEENQSTLSRSTRTSRTNSEASVPGLDILSSSNSKPSKASFNDSSATILGGNNTVNDLSDLPDSLRTLLMNSDQVKDSPINQKKEESVDQFIKDLKRDTKPKYLKSSVETPKDSLQNKYSTTIKDVEFLSENSKIIAKSTVDLSAEKLSKILDTASMFGLTPSKDSSKSTRYYDSNSSDSLLSSHTTKTTKSDTDNFPPSLHSMLEENLELEPDIPDSGKFAKSDIKLSLNKDKQKLTKDDCKSSRDDLEFTKDDYKSSRDDPEFTKDEINSNEDRYRREKTTPSRLDENRRKRSPKDRNSRSPDKVIDKKEFLDSIFSSKKDKPDNSATNWNPPSDHFNAYPPTYSAPPPITYPPSSHYPTQHEPVSYPIPNNPYYNPSQPVISQSMYNRPPPNYPRVEANPPYNQPPPANPPGGVITKETSEYLDQVTLFLKGLNDDKDKKKKPIQKKYSPNDWSESSRSRSRSASPQNRQSRKTLPKKVLEERRSRSRSLNARRSRDHSLMKNGSPSYKNRERSISQTRSKDDHISRKKERENRRSPSDSSSSDIRSRNISKVNKNKYINRSHSRSPSEHKNSKHTNRNHSRSPSEHKKSKRPNRSHSRSPSEHKNSKHTNRGHSRSPSEHKNSKRANQSHSRSSSDPKKSKQANRGHSRSPSEHKNSKRANRSHSRSPSEPKKSKQPNRGHSRSPSEHKKSKLANRGHSRSPSEHKKSKRVNRSSSRSPSEHKKSKRVNRSNSRSPSVHKKSKRTGRSHSRSPSVPTKSKRANRSHSRSSSKKLKKKKKRRSSSSSSSVTSSDLSPAGRKKRNKSRSRSKSHSERKKKQTKEKKRSKSKERKSKKTNKKKQYDSSSSSSSDSDSYKRSDKRNNSKKKHKDKKSHSPIPDKTSKSSSERRSKTSRETSVTDQLKKQKDSSPKNVFPVLQYSKWDDHDEESKEEKSRSLSRNNSLSPLRKAEGYLQDLTSGIVSRRDLDKSYDPMQPNRTSLFPINIPDKTSSSDAGQPRTHNYPHAANVIKKTMELAQEYVGKEVAKSKGFCETLELFELQEKVQQFMKKVDEPKNTDSSLLSCLDNNGPVNLNFTDDKGRFKQSRKDDNEASPRSSNQSSSVHESRLKLLKKRGSTKLGQRNPAFESNSDSEEEMDMRKRNRLFNLKELKDEGIETLNTNKKDDQRLLKDKQYSSKSKDTNRSPSRGKDSFKSKGRGRSNSRGRYRSRSRGRYRSRSRGRNRSRSRGRDRSRSRGRNRSISRGRHRSTSRGRNRSKSRGRNRSRSRGRHRSISRGRNRSRSRGRNRSISRGRNRSISRGRYRSRSRGRNRSISRDRGRSGSRSRGRNKSRSRSRGNSRSTEKEISQNKEKNRHDKSDRSRYSNSPKNEGSKTIEKDTILNKSNEHNTHDQTKLSGKSTDRDNLLNVDIDKPKSTSLTLSDLQNMFANQSE